MTLAANLAALARRVVGTAANNLVALDAGGKLPAINGAQLTGLVLTKDSGDLPETAIVAGGYFELTHGLGASPKMFTAELLCKVAENGFTAGQRTPVAWWGENVTQAANMQLTYDATKIYGRFGTYAQVFQPLNFGTGAFSNPTNANWRLILRAYA